MDLTIRPSAAESLLDDAENESHARKLNKEVESGLRKCVETGEPYKGKISKPNAEEILSDMVNVKDFSFEEFARFDSVNAYYEYKLNKLKELYATGEIGDEEFENRVGKLLEGKVEYEIN